ncbi:MAG: 4-diphosphocytidyl-2-C-methyl-D-erythritol kinase [Verrucomicrobiales bacterium]|jgi:4-diphosphocytidyl-2-C-methyl-D-erythritol kinase
MPVDSNFIELAAAAKINLSLRVLRRREDGFHEIETRMVPIPGVIDKVRLEWMGEDCAVGTVEILCDAPGVPTDETNLAVKAVRELEADCGEPFPALRIKLEKNIPSGAGLGGGSSDAASVLLAVNQLANLGYSQDQLATVAARVGSDVPFFVYGCACDCSGRGEKVTPLVGETIDLPPVLLVKPPFGVETPGAYMRWQESREIPGVLYLPQESAVGALVNDLERPVFEKFPFLADLKMWLLARPEVANALMSGSGATVFALLKDGTQSALLEADLRQQFGDDVWIGRS